MPPARKKNVFVIVVDLRAEELSIVAALDKLLVNKAIVDSNDEAYVIYMHLPDNGLDYVKKTTPMPLSDETIIKNYRSHVIRFRREKHETLNCWTTVLEDAASIFHTCSLDSKNVYTWVLIFLADCHLHSDAPQSVTNRLIDIINENDIRFIACIDKKIDYADGTHMETPEDLKHVAKNINFTEINDQFEKIRKIAEAVEGVMCDNSTFLDFIELCVNKPPKQDFLVPLTIGTYQFATKTRKVIDVSSALVKKSFKYRSNHYYKSLTYDDEPTTSTYVPPDQAMRAYNFHGKLLTLPADVKESFKQENDRMLKIIGFVEAEKVPNIYLGGHETYAIQINEKAPVESQRIFVDFVRCLREENKYALVVRVYNRNVIPKLFFLMPQQGWFLMNSFPEMLRDHQPIASTPGNMERTPQEHNNDMLTLRNALIRKGHRTLFHPSCELGVYRKIVIEKIRKHIAYAPEMGTAENVVEAETVDEELTKTYDESLRMLRLRLTAARIHKAKNRERQQQNSSMEMEDDDDW